MVKDKNKRRIIGVWFCILLLLCNSLTVWASPQKNSNDLVSDESNRKIIFDTGEESDNEAIIVEEGIREPIPKTVSEEVGEAEKRINTPQDDTNSSEYNENLTLLFEEDTDIVQMEELLHEIDQDYKLTIIEEINLVQIQSVNPIKENDIILNSELNNQLDDYGVLVPIQQEGISLMDIEAGMDNVYLESLDNDSGDLELLEALSWNVDDVTNNRESLKLSSGDGVEIALIDSGIDYLHPVLQHKVDLSDAKSYIPTENLVRDTNGHGTMVAGVIAQIAPNASITPYRVISESDGESIWTIEAIVQAVNDGKQIINMSLGTYKNTSDESESLTVKAFERAINYAESKGVIIVSSSGNLSLDLDANYEEKYIRHLPGSVEGVLAVSSTTKGRAFASYSNYGSNVQFSAPGGDVILNEGMIDLGEWIYTTYPIQMDNGLGSLGVPSGYMFSVGTSLSAPAVTAGIADLMSYYNKMTGLEPEKGSVFSYLQKSALDLGTPGYDRYFGNGLINLYDTLLSVEDCLPPTANLLTSSVEINTKLEVKSLVENITDNHDMSEDIKVYFDEDYSFSELGETQILVILEDSSGNKNTLAGMVSVVDTTPPNGKIRNVQIHQGETVNVDELVYDIEDNAGADQVIAEFVKEVDSSELGKFPIDIKLSDQSGNSTLINGEVEIIPIESKPVEIKPEVVKEKNEVLPTKATLVKNSNKRGTEVGNVPNTGDDTYIGFALLGMVLSGIMITGSIKGKRKKLNNQ